jgi:hypothetical protein
MLEKLEDWNSWLNDERRIVGPEKEGDQVWGCFELTDWEISE